jgi:hypothetical protein
MPAWSEARRAGRQSRAVAQAKRAAPESSKVALPRAKERFEKQVCVYCRGKLNRRVGLLPITGPVMYCKDHVEQYKDDKAWEAKYKLETGM